MKILFCGDVMGRSGREAVYKYVPHLRQKLDLDIVIVNGENATHGVGISSKHCQEFYENGVDVITTGNHVWDQKETIKYIATDPRLMRPINFPDKTPGKGFVVLSLSDNRKILVINAMARLFMDPLEDPFAIVDKLLKEYPLGNAVHAIILDFHGEATSEKNAMGHFVDGRVTLSIGTHCHIPTADHRILPKGTAFQTDAGMCGDYDSVIGVVKETPILRFTTKMPTEKLTPAQGPGTLCGVYVESDDKTGLATLIRPVRLGPILEETSEFK